MNTARCLGPRVCSILDPVMDRSEEAFAPDRFRQVHIRKAASDSYVGKGAFARVEKVIWHSTPCAAKFFHKELRDADAKPSTEGDEGEIVNKPFEDFIREAEEWSRLLIHPNIVQYLDLWRDPDGDDPKNVAIIMELLPTNLHDFLESNVQFRHSFPLRLKNTLLIDVTRAMIYLHAQGIYHRDLTAKNVLLDRSLRAKVADFGVAKMYNSTTRLPLSVQPGTKDFMPPEALVDPPTYDKTLDCFSFGCLMLYMFTHEWPHPTDTRIEEGNTEQLSEEQRRQMYIDHLLPTEQVFYPLIQACLSVPSNRPSFEKIFCKLKEHPFIEDDLEYLAAVRSQLFTSNHGPKQDLEHDRSHEQGYSTCSAHGNNFMTAEEDTPESPECHISEPVEPENVASEPVEPENAAPQQQPVPQHPQPIPSHNSFMLMLIIIAVLVVIVAYLLSKEL